MQNRSNSSQSSNAANNYPSYSSSGSAVQNRLNVASTQQSRPTATSREATNNSQYMPAWTVDADHVNLYSAYKKPSTDGFDRSDLGLGNFVINESNFSDVV